MKTIIDIPFGAQDSELKGWTYTIPEGYTAKIENDKIIVVPLSCFKAQNCISNCHLTEKDKRFIRVLIDIIKEDYSDYSFLSPTENENEYEYIETDEMVEMLEKIIK